MKIPDNLDYGFMDAANGALRYVSNLPAGHPHRKIIDVDRVKAGYSLLKSGEVSLFPVPMVA